MGRMSNFYDKKNDSNYRTKKNGFVALCPELDIASQGKSIEDARKNLQEALELFF